MSGIATNLLRSLLSTQAPVGGQTQAASTAGGLNFASLLSAARAGEMTSDRPVEVSAEAAGKLTPDQLQRLAVAADHAESTGMSNALVLIDGQAVKIDVLSREVTAVMDPRTVAVTDIDGVLAAPPSSLAAQVSGDGSSSNPATAAGVLEQQLLARLGGGSNGLVPKISPRLSLR